MKKRAPCRPRNWAFRCAGSRTPRTAVGAAAAPTIKPFSLPMFSLLIAARVFRFVEVILCGVGDLRGLSVR